MSAQGEFALYLELDHLRGMTAQPEYFLRHEMLDHAHRRAVP